MTRSTRTQKAKRLNAAYRLLAQSASRSQAAATLVRKEGISLRQAYRYLDEAAGLDGPVSVAEPAQPITFKLPGNVIRALRRYAAAHELTLSEVVTRAIRDFVARARGHG